MLGRGASLRVVLELTRHLRRRSPRDRRGLLALGKAEILGGRPDAADVVFEEALALYPRDARLAFDVALFHLSQGLPERARVWALRGRELAPELPDFALLMLRSYGAGRSPREEEAEKRWADELEELLARGATLSYWREFRDLPAHELLGGYLRFQREGADAADVRSWIRRDIESIAEQCRMRDIDLVIMSYPTRNAGSDIDYGALAASQAALFVDIEAVFRRLRDERPDARLFAPDGHCNAAGYGVIAQALAEALERAGLVP